MTGDAEYYTLEWRGRQTPPMDYAAIREALEAGDINSMYKINDQGRWRLLRDFLEDYTPPRPPAPAPVYEPPPEPVSFAAPPPPPAHPPAASWHAASPPPPAPGHATPMPAAASPKWPMYALIGLVVVLIPVCIIGGYVLLRPQPVVQAKATETKPAEEKPAEAKPAAETEKPKTVAAVAVAAEPEPKKSPGHNLSIEELTELKSDFVVRVFANWEEVDKSGDVMEAGGRGSGVHISNKDGYAIFVTNRHVLEPPEGFRNYTATMIFKDKRVPIEILSIARYGVDLAKIRVKYPEGKDGPVLDTMKLENLKVGQSCVAIGNALGIGISVTSGIISRFDENQNCKYVRTSAPISPGNSGGALFRQNDGALIGITTSSLPGNDGTAQNINRAIPVDYIFSDLFWQPRPE